MFDVLRGANNFSTLDLASGYHHIPVNTHNKEKTGCFKFLGHYEYTVMPFGVCNAPVSC